MRCEDVVGLLPDYSVDLVRGRKRAAIADHLAHCSACVAEYRALLDTVSLVSALPPSEPVRPLWPGTLARIEARAAESRPTMRRHRARVLGPLAAAAAAAGVALALLRGPSPDLPPAAYASAEAPYVRAHLQYASFDPLSGRAGAEPLIVLVGRAEGDQRR